MKTFYLFKSFLPLVFLPLAPGVVQAELVREGILAPAGGELLVIVIQVIFTLAIVAWLGFVMNRKNKAKAFLKMSAQSKKVFHQGEWMSVEQYLDQCHNIVVSHGLTPEECENWIRESEAYLGAELPALKSELRPWTTPRQVAVAK